MSVDRLTDEQILNLAMLKYMGEIRKTEGEEKAKRVNNIRLKLLGKEEVLEEL